MCQIKDGLKAKYPKDAGAMYKDLLSEAKSLSKVPKVSENDFKELLFEYGLESKYVKDLLLTVIG